MEKRPDRPVTELLMAAREGDTDAFDRVYQLLYEELRRMAHAVRHGRGGETLCTTALVHEAYLKLLPSRHYGWQGRAHFFGVAARAMRQVLVNAAEAARAGKRGGDALLLTLDERLHSPVLKVDQLLILEDAIKHLDVVAPRQARVVECRFFAGLSVEETADALDISTPTVKRDWRTARAWLASALA